MLGFTELFRELEESGVGVKPWAPRGFAALFSCKSGERAFETGKLGKGHGVFFHYVVDGLKGKAKNNKGEVTWSSLADYVIDRVSDDVPTLIGGGARQTPEDIRYPPVDDPRDRLRRAGWSLGAACLGQSWQVDGGNGENSGSPPG
jgi:hypothetical protein